MNRPVGGRWKKLKATALSERREQPEPEAPEDRDDDHGEQVDDAQRDGGAIVFSG